MNDGAETPPAVTPEYQKAGWVGPGERPTLPQWKKCLKSEDSLGAAQSPSSIHGR